MLCARAITSSRNHYALKSEEATLIAGESVMCRGYRHRPVGPRGQSASIRHPETVSLARASIASAWRVVAATHARARKVCVCGEMASDPQGARILVGLGIDSISVSTARFAKVKLSLRDATLAGCQSIAREALK